MSIEATVGDASARLGIGGDCPMAALPQLARQLRRIRGANPAALDIDLTRAGEFDLGPSVAAARRAHGVAGPRRAGGGNRSGRMEMIDTGVDTADEKKAVEEAKRLGAEAVLLLTAKEADRGTLLREQLFWTQDGVRFFDAEVKVDTP